MPYYHDDGTEFFPNLLPKPEQCMSCTKNYDPSEEVLCNLTRMGQFDEGGFKCYSHNKILIKL